MQNKIASLSINGCRTEFVVYDPTSKGTPLSGSLPAREERGKESLFRFESEAYISSLSIIGWRRILSYTQPKSSLRGCKW
jgi:hypothetical protein